MLNVQGLLARKFFLGNNVLNYLEIAKKKIEELSKLEFLAEKNESLKNLIITSLTDGGEKEVINSKMNNEYNKIINEINENSNIQMILNKKSEKEILEIFNDLIDNHKEQNNLKKIESLEKDLINNLDENSYSELIKLKSQLNRD